MSIEATSTAYRCEPSWGGRAALGALVVFACAATHYAPHLSSWRFSRLAVSGASAALILGGGYLLRQRERTPIEQPATSTKPPKPEPQPAPPAQPVPPQPDLRVELKALILGSSDESVLFRWQWSSGWSEQEKGAYLAEKGVAADWIQETMRGRAASSKEALYPSIAANSISQWLRERNAYLAPSLSRNELQAICNIIDCFHDSYRRGAATEDLLKVLKEEGGLDKPRDEVVNFLKRLGTSQGEWKKLLPQVEEAFGTQTQIPASDVALFFETRGHNCTHRLPVNVIGGALKAIERLNLRQYSTKDRLVLALNRIGIEESGQVADFLMNKVTLV